VWHGRCSCRDAEVHHALDHDRSSRCDSPSGEQPDQLEAPEAFFEQKDPYEGASISGEDAVVSGSDRDWSVAVTDGGTVPMVAFHVPGASDLSVLEGGSLDIELGSAWGDDSRTVRIDDETGPRFSSSSMPTVVPRPISSERTSSRSATRSARARWTTTTARGRSRTRRQCSGPTTVGVEAKPGEPFVATIEGVDWRIVVHGSFEVTKTPDTLPGCGGGIGTTLSFEMLAVVTPPALDAVAPLAGARTAGHHSCG
jgi:hypothetical protein